MISVDWCSAANVLTGGSVNKRKKPAFDDCARSATVDKLLDLVGRGSTHVETAAEIARAVRADQPNDLPKSLDVFASCGTSGKNNANTERDLMRWTRGCYGLKLEPYSVEMTLHVP